MPGASAAGGGRGLALGWTVSVWTPDSLSTLLCVLGSTGLPLAAECKAEVQRAGHP